MKRKSVFFVLFWCLVSAVLALGALEIGYRVMLPPGGWGTGRTLQPYLVNGQLASTLADSLNSEGPDRYGYEKIAGVYGYTGQNKVSGIADRGDFLFNDTAAANAIDDKESLRVFIVGGSAAQGIGASQENLKYSVLLNQALEKELKRKVRVINAAVPSYVSTQERLVLELSVLPRCPDAVIFFDGYNDTSGIEGGSRPGDPFNQASLYEDYYSPISRPKKILSDYSRMLRHFAELQYQRVYQSLLEKLERTPEFFKAEVENITSVYLDNLFRMLNSCEKTGIPCLAFLQPTRLYPASKDETSPRPGYFGNLVGTVYLGLSEQFAEAKAKGWKTYDFTRVFEKSQYKSLFTDYVHFNDEGQRKVAEAMLPIVARALRAKPAKRCFMNGMGWNGMPPDH